MTENSPEHRPPLDAEQVAEYLREHPEFFVEHDELIPERAAAASRGWSARCACCASATSGCASAWRN